MHQPSGRVFDATRLVVQARSGDTVIEVSRSSGCTVPEIDHLFEVIGPLIR